MDLTFGLGFVSALFAASGGQYVSHRLTIKREDRKERKVRYEKLYYPKLDDVLSFIELNTIPYHGNIKETFKDDLKNILQNIYDHIGGNGLYAEVELLSSYKKYSEYKWKTDLSGINYPLVELEVLQAYVMESIDIMEELGISISMKLIKTEMLLGIMVLARKLIPYEMLSESAPRLWAHEYKDNLLLKEVRGFSKIVREQQMTHQSNEFYRSKYLIETLQKFAIDDHNRNILNEKVIAALKKP